jgi:RNA polymerase sigma-70 factor, ECF subfamily
VQAVLVTARSAEVQLVEDLDELFRAHYARLVRALTAAGGNREAAADAVQEAFVAAHLHWRKVRRYDDPVGWVRRVALNKLTDEGRRLGRRHKVVERLAARPADHAAPPDADDDGVASLLAGLPRRQRVALALYYVDDLAVTAIAAAMGISEGAVKFHLHEGRARLRSTLEEADDE